MATSVISPNVNSAIGLVYNANTDRTVYENRKAALEAVLAKYLDATNRPAMTINIRYASGYYATYIVPPSGGYNRIVIEMLEGVGSYTFGVFNVSGVTVSSYKQIV